MEVSEEEMYFIRAVLANPDDDAVRLVYSDWLEEQGRLGGNWFSFREYIRCSAEWWLKHADEVTKYHPICEVHLITHPIYIGMRPEDGLITWDASHIYNVNMSFVHKWPQIKFVFPNGTIVSNGTAVRDGKTIQPQEIA